MELVDFGPEEMAIGAVELLIRVAELQMQKGLKWFRMILKSAVCTIERGCPSSISPLGSQSSSS
ncbi:MAG: hypothetical protein DRN15_07695 [Thermoprotei archaeon]|nr:MAG: hypothetical protein DRN15_07695 [Thermoprotei archaeon]